MPLYHKGRRAEYRLIRLLEDNGFFCIRSAGSFSPFDIFATDEEKIFLFQVKFCRSSNPKYILKEEIKKHKNVFEKILKNKYLKVYFALYNNGVFRFYDLEKVLNGSLDFESFSEVLENGLFLTKVSQIV
jgi:Holliday junction resolvase